MPQVIGGLCAVVSSVSFFLAGEATVGGPGFGPTDAIIMLGIAAISQLLSHTLTQL
jgi:hypothetical protein